MIQGSCLCGAVRFEMSGPYKWFTHCHCSLCRKQHGTFHSTGIAVDKSNFRFLQGEDAIVHYRSSPAFERPFCKHCGSKVPDASGEYVNVPAGSLDGDPGIVPRAHIFVADKSPMETITDSLKQFAAYPEGFGVPMAAPVNVDAHAPGTHGSCLCGDVAYAIDTAPTKTVQCHCSRCRKTRGAAHGVNAFVPQASLRFTRGEERVRLYKMPGAFMYATSFCERCGGLMPTLFAPMKMYLVPVGALDTPFQVQSSVNIYVGSKAPWHTITNSFPQFDELPPRERFAEFF